VCAISHVFTQPSHTRSLVQLAYQADKTVTVDAIVAGVDWGAYGGHLQAAIAGSIDPLARVQLRYNYNQLQVRRCSISVLTAVYHY
jgi:hypothetical protein